MIKEIAHCADDHAIAVIEGDTAEILHDLERMFGPMEGSKNVN